MDGIQYGKENVEYKGHTIRVQHDEVDYGPDEWGNTDLFLTGNHRQFWVERDTPDNIEEYDVFPLEAYIHSGVALALGGSPEAGSFPDRMWDVSCVGNVYVNKEAFKGVDTRKAAKSLVEQWNQYLSGDIWYIEIRDSEGEEVESLGGIYGYEVAVKEAVQYIENRL